MSAIKPAKEGLFLISLFHCIGLGALTGTNTERTSPQSFGSHAAIKELNTHSLGLLPELLGGSLGQLQMPALGFGFLARWPERCALRKDGQKP